MMKSFTLAVLLGAGSTFACTIMQTVVRFDTVAPGVVEVSRSQIGTPNGRTVIKTSRYADLKTHFQGLFQSSPLLFIGRIDSVIQSMPGNDTVPLGVVVDLDLASSTDTEAFAYRIYMRLHIDTLLKGSLPGKIFWVRTRKAFNSCETGYQPLTKRAFLNASPGLMRLEDIQLNPTLAGAAYVPSFPTAQWFDGRYLVSPDFPGLRLDITELYPDYPATSVVPRRPPLAPLRPDGKAYRPDGRIINPDAAPKSPVPLLR